ncbi:MAG: ComF family protein [SAR324 cluster bacterium]|nr:ComF family protein [SAR324 cluster bacterium]
MRSPFRVFMKNDADRTQSIIFKPLTVFSWLMRKSIVPRCRVCETAIFTSLSKISTFYLCESCLTGLPWLHPVTKCSRCGNVSASPVDTCLSCSQQPWFIDHTVNVLEYDGMIRDWIIDLKFGKQTFLAPMLGWLMARDGVDETEKIDTIIPLPLHQERLRSRCFNQAALLAHYFKKHANVPCQIKPSWLVRTRNTLPQSQLTGEERYRNVRAAFEANKDVNGNHLLIIDDVMTTGATLNMAAQALKNQGARYVSVLTLARTFEYHAHP